VKLVNVENLEDERQIESVGFEAQPATARYKSSGQPGQANVLQCV
jgi:hypothetical protein